MVSQERTTCICYPCIRVDADWVAVRTRGPKKLCRWELGTPPERRRFQLLFFSSLFYFNPYSRGDEGSQDGCRARQRSPIGTGPWVPNLQLELPGFDTQRIMGMATGAGRIATMLQRELQSRGPECGEGCVGLQLRYHGVPRAIGLPELSDRLKAAQDAAANMTAETVAASMSREEKLRLSRVRNIGIAVRGPHRPAG